MHVKDVYTMSWWANQLKHPSCWVNACLTALHSNPRVCKLEYKIKWLHVVVDDEDDDVTDSLASSSPEFDCDADVLVSDWLSLSSELPIVFEADKKLLLDFGASFFSRADSLVRRDLSKFQGVQVKRQWKIAESQYMRYKSCIVVSHLVEHLQELNITLRHNDTFGEITVPVTDLSWRLPTPSSDCRGSAAVPRSCSEKHMQGFS